MKHKDKTKYIIKCARGIDMENKKIIDNTIKFVKEELKNDFTGHDFWHIHRVNEMAKKIACEENADVYICEMAALLHDIADYKIIEDEEEGLKKVRAFLEKSNVKEEDIHHIIEIISTMSFKGGNNKEMSTLEGKIVQDADRLDAIGAIGIARCMCYSGVKGRPIYNPNEYIRKNMTVDEYRSNKGNAINHFYEKLLKLKDSMNTNTGKILAQGRHRYLENYLEQFYNEWEGKM